MSPLHTHLALVHLPVVGFPLILAGWVLAWRRDEPFWERLFSWLWLLLALLAGAVYFSGGAAYEQLRLAAEAAGGGWPLQAAAETHGVAGRAAFLVLLLSGAAQLQGVMARFQGQAPARAQRWTALGLGLAAVVLLLLAAWLGGAVGHPALG